MSFIQINTPMKIIYIIFIVIVGVYWADLLVGNSYFKGDEGKNAWLAKNVYSNILKFNFEAIPQNHSISRHIVGYGWFMPGVPFIASIFYYLDIANHNDIRLGFAFLNFLVIGISNLILFRDNKFYLNTLLFHIILYANIYFIFSTNRIHGLTLSASLVFLSIVFMQKFHEKFSLKINIIISTIIILAIYVRPTAIFVAPIYFGYLIFFINGHNLIFRFRMLLVSFFVFFFMLLPWSLMVSSLYEPTFLTKSGYVSVMMKYADKKTLHEISIKSGVTGFHAIEEYTLQYADENKISYKESKNEIYKKSVNFDKNMLISALNIDKINYYGLDNNNAFLHHFLLDKDTKKNVYEALNLFKLNTILTYTLLFVSLLIIIWPFYGASPLLTAYALPAIICLYATVPYLGYLNNSKYTSQFTIFIVAGLVLIINDISRNKNKFVLSRSTPHLLKIGYLVRISFFALFVFGFGDTFLLSVLGPNTEFAP